MSRFGKLNSAGSETIQNTKTPLADLTIDEQAFAQLQTETHDIQPWNQVPGLKMFLMKGPRYTTDSRDRRFESKELEADLSNLYAHRYVCETILPCQLTYMVALGRPIYDWGDYIAHGSHNWQKFNDSISWSYFRYKGKEIVAIIKKDVDGNLVQRSDYHDGKLVSQVHILPHTVRDGQVLNLQENPKKVRILHDMLCETVAAESKRDKDKSSVLGFHCASGIGRTGVGITGSLVFLRHSELATKLPSDLPEDPVKVVDWVRKKSGRKLLLASLTGLNNTAQFTDSVKLAKALGLEHAQCLLEKQPRKKVSDLVQLTGEEEKAVLAMAKSMQASLKLTNTLFIFNIDKTTKSDFNDSANLRDKFKMVLATGGEVGFHTKEEDFHLVRYQSGIVGLRTDISKQDIVNEKFEDAMIRLLNNYSNISRVVYYYDDSSLEPNFPAMVSILEKQNKTFCARPYVNPDRFAEDFQNPAVYDQKNVPTAGSADLGVQPPMRVESKVEVSASPPKSFQDTPVSFAFAGNNNLRQPLVSRDDPTSDKPAEEGFCPGCCRQM